jgi:hypothetical protein
MTLKAARPSVLWASLAIVVNKSHPIGFVMGPSESTDLSATFTRFIDLVGIPNYIAKPIHSDEGSALQAYTSRIGAEHFSARDTFMKDLALAHPSPELSIDCYSRESERNSFYLFLRLTRIWTLW